MSGDCLASGSVALVLAQTELGVLQPEVGVAVLPWAGAGTGASSGFLASAAVIYFCGFCLTMA